MELKLKQHSKNSFPREGVFIKSNSISSWLVEIQNLGLTLENCRVFPVPGTAANELFGCIVLVGNTVVKDLGKNNFYQLIEHKLFIPEHSIVVPKLTKGEWTTLFSDKYHLLHPDIGLVELEEEVVWSDFIKSPDFLNVKIIEPSKSVAIPSFISSLRIEVDQEELLKQIENPYSEEEESDEKLPFNLKKLMMGNNKEMDKFLAYLEKNPEKAMKLAIPLDTIGAARGGNEGQFTFNSGFGSNFNSEGLGRNFEKLLSGDGFKINMIRYGLLLLLVISIRSCGNSGTGINSGDIMKFMMIAAVVLFIIKALASGINENSSSSSSKGGGAALVDSERFNTLHNRYEKMAEEYASRKEYEKSAHIYLKLLKNYHKAAAVLEQGKLYREAAGVYLKYLQNKVKAAECYEKGHVYSEAIALYKELNENEKVGDLYLLLKNKKTADRYFRIVIEDYKKNFQYVKASLVYKNKMGDVREAQELLLEGWKTNRDASNCLNNYFANILSLDALSKAITAVYEKEVSETNNISFLNVLKYEFNKTPELEEITKSIAYEIVASKIDERPELASELLNFNKNNTTMTKDIMKYKLKVKKRY
ncbi:hypothetical protein [Flavobacterium hungaricum]|uniref:MoxR-vWA-beta-propeller ternary system domain-containing protein n=1 Tax=Flavobacterium hungaricum TaxID=2082725 RepID=A0ABR9TN25_9FLAO|nr:hypothetical protein [Flavobacterium hungaricum]MBE8726768.1 hypothetical protein [Flavobacterium hungaricum]